MVELGIVDVQLISEEGVTLLGHVDEPVARGLHERGAGLLGEPVSGVMTAEVHSCTPDVSVTVLWTRTSSASVRTDGLISALATW